MSHSVRNHAVLTMGMCLVLVLIWPQEIQAADSLLVAQVPTDDTVAYHILRYDGETGEYVDLFVPMGSGGLIAACCMTWGPDQNLYVGDVLNSRILKYSPTGEYLGEFIPPGYGGLGFMIPLNFGPDGNFYVGDWERGAILRYDGATGVFIDEFVPPGGILTPFGGIQWMVFGPDGNLYVAVDNDVLRFHVPTGAFMGTFATSMYLAHGLVFGEDGNLYVSVSMGAPNGGVDRFDGTTGAFIDHFVPLGTAGLTIVGDLAIGPDDNLYVVSVFTDSVYRFDGETGAFIDEFATGVLGPRGLLFSPKFDVCHTSRRGLKTRTLSVGHLEVDEHVGHGDALGPCPGGVRGGSPIVHQTGGE